MHFGISMIFFFSFFTLLSSFHSLHFFSFLFAHIIHLNGKSCFFLDCARNRMQPKYGLSNTCRAIFILFYHPFSLYSIYSNKIQKNFIEHEQILCAALVCVITIHFISVDTSSQLHSIESNFLHSTAAAIFIRKKVR